MNSALYLLLITAFHLLRARAASGSGDVNVQPASDLIARQFGATAASTFSLIINGSLCPSSSGCFEVKPGDQSITITASSIAELTYGIGYYTRFGCGLTVGWPHGGGSLKAPLSGRWVEFTKETPLSHGQAWSVTNCLFFVLSKYPTALRWPCHDSNFSTVMKTRAVAYTWEDNVCTHSYR